MLIGIDHQPANDGGIADLLLENTNIMSFNTMSNADRFSIIVDDKFNLPVGYPVMVQNKMTGGTATAQGGFNADVLQFLSQPTEPLFFTVSDGETDAVSGKFFPSLLMEGTPTAIAWTGGIEKDPLFTAFDDFSLNKPVTYFNPNQGRIGRIRWNESDYFTYTPGIKFSGTSVHKEWNINEKFTCAFKPNEAEVNIPTAAAPFMIILFNPGSMTYMVAARIRYLDN